MRIALLLLLVYCTPVILSDQPNAYLAFKVRNPKLERQIDALYSKITSLFKSLKYHNRLEASIKFVHSDSIEIPLINFFYDPSEHRQMVPSIMANVTEALCSSYPRYLAFDRYFKDGLFLKGGIQDLDYTRFGELARVLNDHGIVYDKNTGISNNKAGFIAGFEFKVPETSLNKGGPEFIKEVASEPLHSSSYVDTIIFCQRPGPFCEEFNIISKQKIHCY